MRLEWTRPACAGHPNKPLAGDFHAALVPFDHRANRDQIAVQRSKLGKRY